MGPPIVVTDDGVSFLHLRKKISMQSSVKSDLGSGTTTVLKQSVSPTSTCKTYEKSKSSKTLEDRSEVKDLGLKSLHSLLQLSPTSATFSA